MPEFKTSYVLENAFAAYRVNRGYHKETMTSVGNFGTRFSNRDLVSHQIHQGLDVDSVLKYWIPEDFVPFTITDEDIEAKNIADKHMRRYALLSLGVLSQFERDVYTAYSRETTSSSHIGILTYFPEFANRELEKKLYVSRLKTDFAESTVIVDKRVENVTLEILKHIPLHMYGTNRYIGGIENKLVSFTKDEVLKVGEVYQLNARVKGSDMERDTKLPLTKLNYVKLKKVTE